MQSQLVCCGCRNLLLYPRGATNIRCALCNMTNTVSSPGIDTSQLICGGCRTLLVYPRAATSVRCSCCSTINIVPTVSQMAHVICGHCHVPLMYPYGAPSVKCAMCNYITNTVSNPMQNARVPIPMQRPNGAMPPYHPSTSSSHSQTVVVENPMSVDESGKLVSNVVVGVTTEKR